MSAIAFINTSKNGDDLCCGSDDDSHHHDGDNLCTRCDLNANDRQLDSGTSRHDDNDLNGHHFN